jgi:hypothetical protein
MKNEKCSQRDRQGAGRVVIVAISSVAFPR